MKNNCYIGVLPNHDGLGARFQRTLTAMALSFELDVEYLHVPMAYEGFGITQEMGNSTRYRGYSFSNNIEYIKNAQLWDNAVNYGGILVTDVVLSNYKIIKGVQNEVYDKLKKDIKNNTTDGNIYLFDSLHRLLWGGIISVENITKHQDKIIEKFDLNDKPTNEVVVHIRRKDIVNHSNRLLSDSYYLDIIKNLIDEYGKENIVITTQRENFNETPYQDYKILYDDEISDIETLKRMINSNVLVISLSSFSIIAAYLNKRKIIVPRKLKSAEKLNRWVYGL